MRALLARDRGDFQRARRCVEEGLALLAGTDEMAMIAQCHHFLGELALIQDDLTDARANLARSLQLSQEVGILRRVAATQRLLGDVARREGKLTEAEGTYREALALASRLGDRPELARLLVSQARLETCREHLPEAARLLRGARSTFQEIGDARGVAGTSLLLARVCLRQKRWKEALQATLTALKSAQAAHLLHPRRLLGLRRRWIKL